MKIDIIIVNWNSGEQLYQCVESVRKFGDGLVGKCIVVDNGSIDGSADFLKTSDDVKLVETRKNLGFASACNIGAKSGSSPFILLLNPDARLLKGSLATPVDFLTDEENSEIGIAGVQLIGEDGEVQKTCAKFPNSIHFIASSLGIAKLFKAADYKMSGWDHLETRLVNHVIGAFYLVRRSLYEQLGGLDERFFVYIEDLDFSYRAEKAQYKAAYLASVSAFHSGGGISEQVKAHRLFYSLRSRILFAEKHFSKVEAFFVATFILLVEPFSRIAFLCLQRRWPGMKELYSGYKMLWSWSLLRLKNSAKL